MSSEVVDGAEAANWKEFWESCARLLAAYPDRPAGMARDTEAKQLERRLKSLADKLLPELCASEHWVAAASVGKGNWAVVPWVAFLDRRETKSAQKGVYPVIHFLCEGATGIRIGLGIAATAYRGREVEKASEVWDELGNEQRTELVKAGFVDVVHGTEDRTPIVSGGLSKRYDKGMVFERFVRREELEQSPDQLTQSLKSLLSAYLDWVETQADKPEGEISVSFLTLMREYADEHIVFASSLRQSRFVVENVDERGCSVARLDAQASVRVTSAAYQSKLELLQSLGGECKRQDLDNTMATVTCYLQMPDLGLKADGRTVVLFQSDGQRAENFISLIHSIGAVTLYKPAILSLVIEAIREGELVDNRIEFDWLLPRFIERMQEYGKEVGEQQLAEGFGRLASDLFWMLAHYDTNQLLDVSAPTAGNIRERVSHARLQEAYWQMLQDADLSKRVLTAIRNKWWPESALVNDMPNYWIIAPGEKAKLWDRWQAEGNATIGWRKTGDLSEYESQTAIEENAESKDAARMLWNFYATMKPGDVVFAKRGRSKVCGWGIVTGDYEYDEEQGPHRSSRSVDWKDVTEYQMPEGLMLPLQTLTPMDSNIRFLCEMKGAYDGVPGLDAIDCEAEEIEEDGTDLIPETDIAESMANLIESIASTGFIFHPWQVATYVTAMRTKPFVILAGVSGTGKSKLPALISKLTTGKIERVSVRPDWTDSSDVLGYVDLQDRFRPGVVLKVARQASTDTERFHVCLLDEMNLARVEHYFAEVLSSIEDRLKSQTGGYESTKLVSQTLPPTYREWQEQTMPSNFGIVGTVNMDESSHGFSRKVLDRAFTLELSEIDLDLDQSAPVADDEEEAYWPPSFWHCRATRISECDQNDAAFRSAAERVTEALKTVNQSLVHSQLQVGYRTRDEVILFLLNANELIDSFVTRDGNRVDPLDLALMMKVLPRLVGGSNSIRRTIVGLLGFSHGRAINESDDAETVVESWISAGRPDAIEDATFPRTTSRLCLMWERLTSEGYTSFWL